MSPKEKALVSGPDKGKRINDNAFLVTGGKDSVSGPGSIQCSNFVLNKSMLTFIQFLTIWLRNPVGHCLLLSLHCMERTEHLPGVGCEAVCALHPKL